MYCWHIDDSEGNTQDTGTVTKSVKKVLKGENKCQFLKSLKSDSFHVADQILHGVLDRPEF